jgi:ABC-2 type transport system ATP-binding protein
LRRAAKIEPMIRTFALAKSYGRRVALRPTTLEIPAGGMTALVGPNGAGKSTMLKLCIGFERPTSGRLEVNGVDPVRQRARAVASIGYVPQAPTLYRDLSIDDHFRFARALRPGFDVAFARDRITALEISPGRKVSELSGGEQAQVGLAIALGTRAPVMLLDEPLANLDPLARRDFLRVLGETVAGGDVTVVLSSHAISEIEASATRLLVLGEGEVLFNDTIAHALGSHRVVENGAPAGGFEVVSSFPGDAGEELLVLRNGLDIGRAPDLEEVVLGYLASTRARRRREAAGKELVA